jgi:hypothetical protein
LLIGLVALGLFPVLFRPATGKAATRLIYATALASVMMVSITNQGYTTTRYTFFLYPLLLLLACTAVWCLARALVRRPAAQILAFYGVMAVFMIPAEDFDVYHLRHVSDPEVNFRTIYQRFRAGHYYQRYDYRSAAESVNAHAERQDVVISLIPVVDFYLDRLDYRFVGFDEDEFPIISACAGTSEIWSNAPLIYRVEDLFERIGSTTGGATWVIALSGKKNEVDQRLRASFGDSVDRVGIDERILVYRIASAQRDPASGREKLMKRKPGMSRVNIP